MKVSRVVFFAWVAQSLVWKGMPSVQNSPVLNPENFFYSSFSEGKEERKESFQSFYRKQIKKMGKGISKEVLSYLDRVLQGEKIPLQINEGELRDDLASFVHRLDTEQDFDEKGFLTPESLEQVRRNGLQITLSAMNPACKLGALFFRKKEGHQTHQKVFCLSPYCGRLRVLPKDENNPKGGGIDVYEIGLTYIPFYIIQVHEFIHMQHFLETFEVSQKLHTLRETIGQSSFPQGRLDPNEFNNLCKKQERFFCPFSELPDEEKVGIDQKEWDSLLAVQKNFDQMVKKKKEEGDCPDVQWTKDCGEHILIYKGNVLVDPKFIPYGLALRIKNYKSYKENLSVVQRESFGKVAEFSDHTFLEDFFATLCETVHLKNDCISEIEKIIGEAKGSLKKQWEPFLQKTISEEKIEEEGLNSLLPQKIGQPEREALFVCCQTFLDQVLKIQREKNVRLSQIVGYDLTESGPLIKENSEGKKVLEISLDELLSFAKEVPEEYNLEEERTCFFHPGYTSEDQVRKEVGIPPRGLYSIPNCETFVLKESMDWQMTELNFSLPTYYSTGLLSQEPSSVELGTFPLLLRLKYQRNREIEQKAQKASQSVCSKKMSTKKTQKILQWLRDIFSVPEPPFTEKMQEKTDTPSSTPQKRVTGVTSSDETASENTEDGASSSSRDEEKS